MTDENPKDWLHWFERWAGGSIGRRRLHRAFWSADRCLAGDTERLLHSYSRLGIWARELSAEVQRGNIPMIELHEHLDQIAEFGDFAFQRLEGHSPTQFEDILHDELIPHFCSDPKRGCDPTGFRNESVLRIAYPDARDFIRAWEGGLLQHDGHGLYRAPKSSAAEQFFWTGPKHSKPRTFTLWHEPIITIAALGRLHWNYGWPANLIGTQSSDWAFDLVAFRPNCETEHIAGEVKKTVSELDMLVGFMEQYGSDPDIAAPPSGKALNAYRKVAALRARRAPIFWAVGPSGYSAVYRVEYDEKCRIALQVADDDVLQFKSGNR